jgi:hypothetical protein
VRWRWLPRVELQGVPAQTHVSPTQAKKFTPSSNVTVAVLLP